MSEGFLGDLLLFSVEAALAQSATYHQRQSGKMPAPCANMGRVQSSGAFHSLRVQPSLGPDSLHLRNLTGWLSFERVMPVPAEHASKRPGQRSCKQLWNPLKTRLAHLPKYLSIHYSKVTSQSQMFSHHALSCWGCSAACCSCSSNCPICGLAAASEYRWQRFRHGEDTLPCPAAPVMYEEMHEVCAVRVRHTLSG